MTNEQAIKQLQDLIQDRQSHFTNDGSYDKNFRDDVSALHIGISAIRMEMTAPTAHWDINCDGYYPFCSNCKESAVKMSKYCPNCGAKMVTRE